MPNATIYIRNEDYAKWQAIKNKPEWLHEHLNVVTMITQDKVFPDIVDKFLPDPFVTEGWPDPTYTEPEDTA